jgi:hypothetical protein
MQCDVAVIGRDACATRCLWSAISGGVRRQPERALFSVNQRGWFGAVIYDATPAQLSCTERPARHKVCMARLLCDVASAQRSDCSALIWRDVKSRRYDGGMTRCQLKSMECSAWPRGMMQDGEVQRSAVQCDAVQCEAMRCSAR